MICERNCNWQDGEQARECPEFGRRFPRSFCELAKTSPEYYAAAADGVLANHGKSTGGNGRLRTAFTPIEVSEDVQEAAADLGIKKLGKRWAIAIGRWLAAGRPVRDKEEMQRIYEVCRNCKSFKEGRCRRCGCRVAAEGPVLFGLIQLDSAMFNKIKMATEWCGQWKKVTRKWKPKCGDNKSCATCKQGA